MKTSFKTTVNSSYDFHFDENQIEQLDIVPQSRSEFHVLDNKTSYRADIIQKNFNKKNYTIAINGNIYDVAISDALDLLISDLGMEVTAEKKENDLKAPMPGLIVGINVAVGQEVKENDGLLVLEAMKMENTLLSPKDGVIKSIAVTNGDRVEKNAILIEIEG